MAYKSSDFDFLNSSKCYGIEIICIVAHQSDPMLPCKCSSWALTHYQVLPCSATLTPHVSKQVILSSSKVLLRSRSWSGGRLNRAGLTPSSKFILWLSDSWCGMRPHRAGVAPAAKVIVVLYGLRRLRRLSLGLLFCGCWVRLSPSIVRAPWVAVSSRD